MKYILIVGHEQVAVGPFDCEDDAASYAVNVLASVSFIVKPIESPISVSNFRLIQQVSA